MVVRTLSNQAVQILIVGSLQSKVSTANIINRLVVHHERTVRMLKGGMGCKNRVVWLNNGGCGLWSRVDAEFQLALLAIVDGQTLHKESTEARSSSTTKRVEDQETLEPRAVVCNTANLVQNLIDQFLADSVVATSVIVGGILLASDHLLWVEQAAVGTGTDLVHDIGLKIAVNGARNIFALAYDAKL
jgi:hypothetical protein